MSKELNTRKFVLEKNLAVDKMYIAKIGPFGTPHRAVITVTAQSTNILSLLWYDTTY